MKYLMLMLVAGSAFASEHETSVTDLIPYIFNFLIVFVPLTIFLKKKATVAFNNYSDRVVKISNDAKLLEAEAKEKAERVDYLVNNFEKVAEEEKQKLDLEFNKYSQEIDEYGVEQIKKLNQDYENRYEYEKELAVQRLNREVIDEIIAEAKKSIEADPNVQKNITNNLMNKIQ